VGLRALKAKQDPRENLVRKATKETPARRARRVIKVIRAMLESREPKVKWALKDHREKPVPQEQMAIHLLKA